MRFKSGLPETACGIGSTMRATGNVRKYLPDLLKKYKIRSMLDAPCGDWNWIEQTDLRMLESYIGLDHSVENLERCELLAPGASMSPQNVKFAAMDLLTTERLPFMDAILCRDFFQHLPNYETERLYDLFKDSGASYLIATCYINQNNIDIGHVGGFRPFNLQIAPLNLGPPLESIEEDFEHFLGIWRL